MLPGHYAANKQADNIAIHICKVHFLTVSRVSVATLKDVRDSFSQTSNNHLGTTKKTKTKKKKKKNLRYFYVQLQPDSGLQFKNYQQEYMS